MNATLVVLVLGVLAVPSVVCALKGKWWMALLFCGPNPIPSIGALHLAKPGSWWYRNKYSDVKRAKADARFATPVRDRMEAGAAKERAEIKAAKALKKAEKASRSFTA
jgi:hypothetical protein